MSYNFYTGEVLLINKPYTWSSFQAVNKLKHAIKQHPSFLVDGKKVKPKIGHAGTLDPLATGLLIVCTGKKTKTINELMGQEKEYTGTFFLGATTPCFDLEKEVDKEESRLNDKISLVRNLINGMSCISEFIKYRRKQLNISQQELADLAKISRVTIHNMENKDKNSTISNIETVLDILGCELMPLVKTPRGSY